MLDRLKPFSCPRAVLFQRSSGGHPSDIESVMVGGEFIMRNNKVLTMDEAAVIREGTPSRGESGTRWGPSRYEVATPAMSAASVDQFVCLPGDDVGGAFRPDCSFAVLPARTTGALARVIFRPRIVVQEHGCAVLFE